MTVTTTPSPPEGLATDNPLWRFALAQWRHPDFEKACLGCQSRGWPVLQLLVAVWMAKQGLRWDGAEPDELLQWRHSITEPLRKMRQGLPRSNTSLGRLRSHIQEAELAAEKLELAWWYEHLLPQLGHAESGWDAVDLTIVNLNALATRRERAMDASLRHLVLTLYPAVQLDQVQFPFEQPGRTSSPGEGE